jgi:hypothetical protein
MQNNPPIIITEQRKKQAAFLACVPYFLRPIGSQTISKLAQRLELNRETLNKFCNGSSHD